ncbi:MAG: response regulator transcription factor [Bacteroidia bacterium]|nr:response regulator transcription factor [Bacteroidia bacterium]
MKFQVIDFTMVQNVDLDENQAKILGTLDKTSSIWNKNIKVALVTDNEKILELIKIYRDSLKETNWVVKTFSDAKDAEEWCNAEKRR